MRPQHRRFAEEYLVDLNAKRAAVRAGYSERSARSLGVKTLARADVQAHIQKEMNRRSDRTGVTADRVINELALVAFANTGKFFTWGPTGVMLVNKDKLTDEEQRAVSEVSETKTEAGGSVRMKLHDKIRALELLGRHLKLFPTKYEVTGEDGKPIEFAPARAELIAALTSLGFNTEKDTQKTNGEAKP